MKKEEHLSLGKVAKQCNVSRTTVYRWIVNGHLKAYSLPSGHYRVRPEDLTQFRQAFGIPDPDGNDPAPAPTATANEAPPPAISPEDDGKLRVLVADDHPDMVLMLSKVVERYLPDSVLMTAKNGVDTCVNVGSFRPDIMLLDIMMPGMDGFAVLQELLRRPELASSRVIIVSAYEPFDKAEEIARLNPQVVRAFRKPISVGSLGEHLQQVKAEIVNQRG